MAYLEVGMWEILDVLRRVHRGESYVAIERATSRTRKTVRRYVRLALTAGWQRSGAEPDEALAGAVVRALKPGTKDAVAGEVGKNDKPANPPRRSRSRRCERALQDGGDLPAGTVARCRRGRGRHGHLGRPRMGSRRSVPRGRLLPPGATRLRWTDQRPMRQCEVPRRTRTRMRR